MHPDYADDNDEEFSSFELSKADQDRWHHRQHHPQVRNQAKEPDEKTDEVKEGHVEQAENSNAYGRNQQSDQKVPYDEALQHLPDQPQSDEGGMAMMQSSLRASASIAPPDNLEKFLSQYDEMK